MLVTKLNISFNEAVTKIMESNTIKLFKKANIINWLSDNGYLISIDNEIYIYNLNINDRYKIDSEDINIPSKYILGKNNITVLKRIRDKLKNNTTNYQDIIDELDMKINIEEMLKDIKIKEFIKKDVIHG